MLIDKFEEILSDTERDILEEIYEGMEFELDETCCKIKGRYFERIYRLKNKKAVEKAVEITDLVKLHENDFRYIGVLKTSFDEKLFFIGYRKYREVKKC